MQVGVNLLNHNKGAIKRNCALLLISDGRARTQLRTKRAQAHDSVGIGSNVSIATEVD
jgi:hypothetical protein